MECSSIAEDGLHPTINPFFSVLNTGYQEDGGKIKLLFSFPLGGIPEGVIRLRKDYEKTVKIIVVGHKTIPSKLKVDFPFIWV